MNRAIHLFLFILAASEVFGTIPGTDRRSRAELLYQITKTATSTNTATYHYASRGSKVALTDGNGNITDRIEYSLYGLITCRAGQTDTPFLFNGRYGVVTDPNGLVYMRARYYNPYLCRFLNADPSGFAGGLNMYAYANGNPVSYLDPSGMGAVGGSLPNWLTPPSAGVDMSQVYSWLGGGGTLPYSVSFPFGDVASVLVPGYASFGTANAAFMAGDYRTAATYGVLGVAEVGAIIGSMGGSEGFSMELNAAQTTAGKTIGLGLDEDLMNLKGTGAITYKDAGWQQAGLTTVDVGKATEEAWFKMSFREASQNADAIRFDVSSFVVGHPDSNLTAYELNHIANDPALFGKTTFIQNSGQVIWNGTGFVKP